MSKQKWFMFIGAALALLLITGCSDNSNSESDSNEETQTEEKTQTEEEKTQSITKLGSDADLTQQLEAENGIESVMVQVVDGENKAVNVDIEINNEQELSADEVIEKYGEVIKEKYPDRIIDIIVVKEGKVLKQTTLE